VLPIALQDLQMFVADFDLAIPLAIGFVVAMPLFFAYRWAAKQLRRMRRPRAGTAGKPRPISPAAVRRANPVLETPGSLAAATAHHEAAAIQLDAAEYAMKRLASELDPMLVVRRSDTSAPLAVEPEESPNDGGKEAAIAA
jgi:hypothetical protein